MEMETAAGEEISVWTESWLPISGINNLSKLESEYLQLNCL